MTTLQNSIEEVDEATLAELIKAHPVVAVEFWKTGCAPCERQMPIFQEAAGMYPDVKFVKVNIAENPRAPFTYKLRMVPAVLVFRNGQRTYHHMGMTALFDIQDAVEAAIDDQAQAGS